MNFHHWIHVIQLCLVPLLWICHDLLMYKPIEDGTEIICFASNEVIIRYTLHASSLNMRDNRTREVTVPTNFKIQLTNSIKYRGLRKIYSSGFHSWESCYTHHTSEHGILSWFPWVCGSDLWKGMSKPLPTAGLCTYLFFLEWRMACVHICHF